MNNEDFDFISWKNNLNNSLSNFWNELIENSNYNESRLLVEEIIKRKPEHISALIDLGVLNVLEQKFEEAKKIFEKVLRLDPENDVA